MPTEFTGKPFETVHEMQPPTSYFKNFFDDELIQHITDQTNLYCTQQKMQKSLKCPHIQIDRDEIEQLLGVLLYIGIYPNPQYRMYWSSHTSLSQITKALKGDVNRFEQLRRILHFNDVENAPAANSPTSDRLYKVRPLISSIVNSETI